MTDFPDNVWAACHDVVMSRASLATSPKPALNPGIEYEFERLTLSRDFSRNFVTRMLTHRAEHEGWELDRLRLSPDGTRRVTLRRKIIRQMRPSYLAF